MSAATINAAEAQRALLDAADELFYERGIAAVSMADVRDASGLSMRRVYTLAESKADLIAQWLRHRHLMWSSGFRDRVNGHLAEGTQPLDAVFNALADWMTETNFRGCGFINTHAEASELTAEHQEIIRSHKAELATTLDTIVGDGAALAVLIDGAIVQAAIFRTTEPIEHARRAASALLNETSRTHD
jgi:AcrR family transcriptional regulator